jgi:ADP-ribose pyrophosphatase YjhB (NUDIX family)
MFNNRDNECIELPDGRTVWLSRASTVVVNVWCFVNDAPHLLLSQRGENTPNEQFKWNLPCGYLDWDETLTDAAEREVFEETGLDLRKLQAQAENILDNQLDQPWKVRSGYQGSSKQNISHHYYFIFKAETLPTLSNAFCEQGEVADNRWVKVPELGNYDYAFRHHETIREIMDLSDLLAPYQSELAASS